MTIQWKTWAVSSPLGALVLAVSFGSCPAPALAQDFGDAKRGAQLAQLDCAQCHATRARQLRSPNPMAPNFTSIATTLGMTDRALRVWLQSSHPRMPNLILTGDERDDVVAYIMSLKSSP